MDMGTFAMGCMNYELNRDNGKLPKDIIFRKNCTIPERGNDWVRLQITDNIKDYNWILK